MKKILTIIMIMSFVFLLNGCNNIEKTYLSDKYYNKSEFVLSDEQTINNLFDNKETFILYTYNNYCSMKIPCETIFKSVMDKYSISFISIPFEKYKETKLYDTVKYAPSIIIVQNGIVSSYLDSNKEEDYDKYQDSDVFEKWISEYIYLSK